MTAPIVPFSDGAGYDRMMGPWSRSVGEVFLASMRPAPGLHWIDVGCGSGAFTELVVEQCAPASILGIDPSEAQLAFARTRDLGGVARFEVGDAMALPLPDASVDVAAAALVIFFMPDPARGVAEMARAVRSGGTVASYGWDLPGGGFPYYALQVEMRAAGFPSPEPPHPEAGAAPELRRLWQNAGLEGIETREIIVTRAFQNFDDYWDTAVTSPRMAMVLGQMPPGTMADLKARLRAALPVEPNGTIIPTARANAIWGRVP